MAKAIKIIVIVVILVSVNEEMEENVVKLEKNGGKNKKVKKRKHDDLN